MTIGHEMKKPLGKSDDTKKNDKIKERLLALGTRFTVQITFIVS